MNPLVIILGIATGYLLMKTKEQEAKLQMYRCTFGEFAFTEGARRGVISRQDAQKGIAELKRKCK